MEKTAEGRDAFTHKALIKYHDVDKVIDSYVKIYCQNVAPKGLVNELIGYTLAKRSGLSVPYRAAVLLLNSEQAAFLPPKIAPLQSSQGHVVAWCVQSLGGKTPYQAYNYADNPSEALATIREDFKKWKELPEVASLDAWLLNEDRNLGNLVRLGKGRYALIDHGRVCTGRDWMPPLERSRMAHTNKLAHIAWDDPDLAKAPKSFHVPLVESFNQHSQSLLDSETDLDYWLPKLISTVEKADVDTFLTERTTTVGNHFKGVYGVLLP